LGRASSDLAELLVQAARESGFPLAGVVDLNLAESHVRAHVERYDEWLKRGFAGAMSYLVRGRDRRADPRLVMPDVQSILCVAIPYPRKPAGAASPAQGPRYARYLQGPDYHDELAQRLESAMQAARARWPEARPLHWKVCVDTSAVLERSWAALAGLGWIGKNTLLIHPKHGSYLFLACVLINQPTGQGPSLLPDFCGNCTRCLNVCPTQALVEPHWVDSNKCISYLTLEKRGELPIDEPTKRAMGSWVAGCDLCQEACPFNLKPARAETGVPPANATNLQDWIALLEELEEGYRQRIKDSALSRIKPPQFRRNLAIAIANATDALDPTSRTALKERVERLSTSDPDPVARAEWIRCLSFLA